MFCKKCGSKLPDNAKFCDKCGAQLTNETIESAVQAANSKPLKDNSTSVKKRNAIVLGSIVVAALLIIIAIAIFVMNNSDYNGLKPTNEGVEILENDIPTEEIEAGVKQADILNTYLEEILIPQYGIVDLSSWEKQIDAPDWEAEMKMYAELAKLDGILSYRILDLDQDEVEELLVIRTMSVDEVRGDYSTYYAYDILSVYEVVGEQVIQTAEATEDISLNRNSEYADNFSIIANDKGVFLLHTHNDAPLIAGYDANHSLWRYNGSTLVPAMQIVQTAGGSSDFEWTSYKYDINGNLVSEEMIHGAGYDDFGSLVWTMYDEDGSILARQYQEYGIEINREIGMYSEIGEFANFISESTECETLCNISMEIEYGDGYKNCYFNGSERLKNDSASVEKYQPVLAALQDELQLSSDVETEGLDYLYFYYDFNGDGYEELFLRKTDNYAWDTLYVYTCVNGEVQKIFEREDVTYYDMVSSITKDGFRVSGCTTNGCEHWEIFYKVEKDSVTRVAEFYSSEYWIDDISGEFAYEMYLEGGEHLVDKDVYEKYLNDYVAENVVVEMTTDRWISLSE